MNEVLEFILVVVFILICSAVCGYGVVWQRKNYVKIFSVTSENKKCDSPAGICISIEREYYVTVYGITEKGKRKELAKTLLYHEQETAEKEGEMLKQVLMKRYNLI